jgi:glycosyltransferase involved in cell wall biosynthesis
MKLAFDARCESGKASSFTRVLELWRHAADVVGLEYTNWHEGFCHADVLISPNSDVSTVKGPLKVPTFHDVNALQPQPSSWLRRAPDIHGLRKTARNLQLNANYILTGSEFSKQSIGDAFPALREKLFVIPHYPSPSFTPGEIDHNLLAKHGLPEKSVLFVSAIRKHKNWDGMLEAWLMLPKELQHQHPLVFVASRKKIRRRLPAENIYFTERISDDLLLHLYRSARLMVFPSFAEGFGLPPLEALCSGCPVIASEATAIPEVLGGQVEYFDPFNSTELYKLLRATLDSPRNVPEFNRKWCAELPGNKLIELLAHLS